MTLADIENELSEIAELCNALQSLCKDIDNVPPGLADLAGLTASKAEAAAESMRTRNQAIKNPWGSDPSRTNGSTSRNQSSTTTTTAHYNPEA